jgi:RNA polymerase sigma-70 factor (ECF subfamily)
MGEKNEPVTSRQQRFEQVAMPHSRSLLRLALRLVNDVSRAEDLVQQTLLHAWRGFDGFRAGTDARAWLFRILLNAFYAQGRKIRATPAVVPLTLADDGSMNRSESAPALETLEIAQAFQSLNLDHRTVLHLNVVEGFTCREIAGILSVPFGTVMSRLSRARQALRARLASDLPKLCESGVEAGMKKRR